MDYATTLHGQVTKGSCSTSLLHEYDYLPHLYKIIRLTTPVGLGTTKQLRFSLLVGIPLNV